MKLHFHPLSHNCRRARSVALHLGVAFDPVVVDVTTGAHKKPEFLALNPNGMIPVLDDEGFVLTESTAIALYLIDKAKSDLLPSAPQARADVLRWLSWETANWNSACATIVFERVFKKMFGGQPDAQAIEAGLVRFNRFAAVLNAQLEGRDFVTGAKVTVADFAIASPLSMHVIAELPLASYPNIVRWFAKMDEVPGWKESAPPGMG